MVAMEWPNAAMQNGRSALADFLWLNCFRSDVSSPIGCVLRAAGGGCGDDRGDSDEERSQIQQRGRQGDGGGKRADEQGAAGIAEFTSDFGAAEGLPETLAGCGGRDVGEPNRRDNADAAPDEDRGGHKPGDTGDEHPRAADSGEHKPDGQAGAITETTAVAGTPGAG
jgi:hypothetical protein